MDSLLQRIISHRHERKRPEMLKSARCIWRNSELDNLEKADNSSLWRVSAGCKHQRSCRKDYDTVRYLSLVQKTYYEIDENQRFQPAYEEYKKEVCLGSRMRNHIVWKAEIGKNMEGLWLGSWTSQSGLMM